MIFSSADIFRILGADAIIRQEAKLGIVDGKPGLGVDEYVYVYIDRYPTVEDFEATWKIWVINGGSDLFDLVLNAMTVLLPKFDFNGKHYTTTDFASDKTVVRSQADIELEATRVERQRLQKDFSGLQEDLQARLSSVRDGRDGRDGIDGRDGLDGKDGRDGLDGRNGRDLVATEANLEDLQNVEQNIAKENGQVLTWKDGAWQNLFIPQLVSSVSGRGTTLANGDYTNQPLTWNGTAWVPGSEIQLDTSNLTDPAEGGLNWEQDEHTAVLGINGMHAHIGHDQFAWCRNNTDSIITKGTAVMFAGTLGNSGRLLVAPMVADGSFPGYYFLGIAAENILPGEDGNVYSYGKIKGVNTSAFAEGSILWCDPTTPGGLTITEPDAPNIKLPIAAVISSQNNGILMVRSKTGERLSDLHDVQVSAPHDGDVLTWVAASNRWEHLPATASGISEAPQDGNYYVRQNASWVLLTDALTALNVTWS